MTTETSQAAIASDPSQLDWLSQAKPRRRRASSSGEIGRELGQARALLASGDWRERVTVEFAAWCRRQLAGGITVCTIEQFRSIAKQQPDSHKAWGAIVRGFVTAKLIAPTDMYVNASSPKTHAHPVRVWKILDGGA